MVGFTNIECETLVDSINNIVKLRKNNCSGLNLVIGAYNDGPEDFYLVSELNSHSFEFKALDSRFKSFSCEDVTFTEALEYFARDRNVRPEMSLKGCFYVNTLELTQYLMTQEYIGSFFDLIEEKMSSSDALKILLMCAKKLNMSTEIKTETVPLGLVTENRNKNKLNVGFDDFYFDDLGAIISLYDSEIKLWKNS